MEAERDTAPQRQIRAWDSGLRPKQCRLRQNARLQEIVAEKLKLNWSPEQISGWLKKEYPAEETMHRFYD